MTSRADWMPERAGAILPTHKAVRDLVERACDDYGVNAHQVLGKSRHRRVVLARHQVWRKLWELGWYASEIGREFGAHHTTVGQALGHHSGKLLGKRVRIA